MKAHIGVMPTRGWPTGWSRRLPTWATSPRAHALLYGQKQEACAKAGYRGVDRRPENEGKTLTWHVAMRCGKRKALPAPGCEGFLTS